MNGSSVPRDLNIEDIDGIAMGSFAQVGLAKNSRYVVKVASRGAYEHFMRERDVYERLNGHPNILRFYGEIRAISSERTLPGILLDYHSAGCLDKMLSTRDLKLPRSE